MSDAFKDRERALENAFFHQIDQELLRKLKESMSGGSNRDQLTAVSGITDAAVLDKLEAIGVAPDALSALSLIPLIQVAWAEHGIQDEEHQAILDAAHQSGIEAGTRSHELLQSWLKKEPTDELVKLWKSYAHAILSDLDGDAKREFTRGVLSRARVVAAATGGILGLGNTVSAVEKSVLDELEKSLAE